MSRFLYADTSALAKVFWRESGSELVLSVVKNADAVASVSLGYVELVSASIRAGRRGDVPTDDVPIVVDAIALHWRDVVRIPVDDALVSEAARLAGTYSVRAYDAVHLAAALRWQSMIREPVLFLAFDKELLEAAKGEGFQTAS